MRRRLRAFDLQAGPSGRQPRRSGRPHVVGRSGGRILDFVPWGWEERQFNSPGFAGFYRGLGGADPGTEQLAILWVLNQSDGSHTLLDIAERSGLAFSVIRSVSAALFEAVLLAESP
jgi:aminopeptidase-like protein